MPLLVLMEELKKLIFGWRKIEASLADNIQNAANTRNRASHLTNSSKLLTCAISDVFNITEKIKDFQNRLIQQTALISNLSNRLDNNVIITIINPIKQQTIWEDVIITTLLDKLSNWSELNQEEVITMLACFKYQPYIDQSVLDMFLSSE